MELVCCHDGLRKDGIEFVCVDVCRNVCEFAFDVLCELWPVCYFIVDVVAFKYLFAFRVIERDGRNDGKVVRCESGFYVPLCLVV